MQYALVIVSTRLDGPETLSFDAQTPKLVSFAVGKHPQVLPILVDVHAVPTAALRRLVRWLLLAAAVVADVVPGGDWRFRSSSRSHRRRIRLTQDCVDQPGELGVAVH